MILKTESGILIRVQVPDQKFHSLSYVWNSADTNKKIAAFQSILLVVSCLWAKFYLHCTQIVLLHCDLKEMHFQGKVHEFIRYTIWIIYY